MQPFSSAVYMCNDLRLVLRSTGAVNVCFPQHRIARAIAGTQHRLYSFIYYLFVYKSELSTTNLRITDFF